MKEKLGTFGSKGETYEAILRKVYDLAVKEHLREFLMSSEGCIPVEEALERAKAKWRK